MKRILLALSFLLALAAPGLASCGPTNPNCIVPLPAPGDNSNRAAPTAFVHAAISALPGGSVGQVQTNGGGGTFGGLTNAQLTALINPATASLSGALPAWPNNTTTFFRGDGTYVTLNCAAIAGVAASCSTDTTNASNISSGTLGAARLPNPTASTLGGIESLVATTHQWINAISTSGVPSSTQPAVGDISGLGTGVATALGNNLNAAGGLLGASNSANPSATASDTAVNGSALTFMRSDAAPAVQKATTSVYGVVKLGATLQANPGTPGSTTSATGVMMGLGSTCAITPITTGRIKFEFLLNESNSTISQTMATKVFFGTGTAPVNGAAITGTQVAAAANVDEGTANFHSNVVNGGIATGLTLSTAYWLDVSLGTTGGTVSAINISCNAFEF